MQIKLKDGVQANIAERVGEVVRVSPAALYPVVANFGGTVVCIGYDEFDEVKPVASAAFLAGIAAYKKAIALGTTRTFAASIAKEAVQKHKATQAAA